MGEIPSGAIQAEKGFTQPNVESGLNFPARIINPLTGLPMPTLDSRTGSQMHPLTAAIGASRAAFPDGMNTLLSRRDTLKRLAGIGLVAGSASMLRPHEARAAGIGFLEQLPPVELSPEALELMNGDFNEVATEILDRVTAFRKWVEKQGGAEIFHNIFANFRSEIQNAMAYGLTPPELATDMRSLITKGGPYAYPADFTDGDPKKANLFGKVALGRLLNGQADDKDLLIGGDVDAIVFGVSFHDYVSIKQIDGEDVKGKAVLVHFGGVNEGKAWNASGFWNFHWPNGEYVSSASQFREETGPENTYRIWPYNPEDPSMSPPPQAGQAGINELVKVTGIPAMASFGVGSTYNYQALMDMDRDYQAKNGVSIFQGLSPDVQDRDLQFGMNESGVALLQRLDLHAVNAMMEAAETGRELGVVQFQGGVGAPENYVGMESMREIFPNAENTKKWPSLKPTSYFLDESKATLTREDLVKLPNILGAHRFAFPSEFSPEFAGVINPSH